MLVQNSPVRNPKWLLPDLLSPAPSEGLQEEDLGGRLTPQVFPAVAAYLRVAAEHGLDPAQMAIAFCLSRPFPCLPIIGATTPAQLECALGAANVTLSPETLAAIDATHRAHPMPF